MKFSIIVPTRSRADCLQWCLKSVLNAADNAGCETEIVVSDNASDDDTPDVVRALGDRRIKYLRTPHRFSMRENFEFGLANSTGTHVTVIGDDDGVLPHGLGILREVIKTSSTDIVNWTLPSFLWPDPAKNLPGRLSVRPLKLSGRQRLRDPKSVLDTFASGKLRSYQNGGKLYHGCVSRRLIDAVLAKTGGPYFRTSAPDVFAAIQNLILTDKPLVLLDYPVTLGGSSPHSNSASVEEYVAAEKGQSNEAIGAFVDEAACDPHKGRISHENLSVEMMTLDAMLLAFEIFNWETAVQRKPWLARIAKEVAPFSSSNREVVARDVQALLDLELPANIGRTGDAPASSEKSTATEKTPFDKLQVASGLAKVSLQGGAELDNIDAAVKVLDLILGDSNKFHSRPSLPASLMTARGILKRAKEVESLV